MIDIVANDASDELDVSLADLFGTSTLNSKSSQEYLGHLTTLPLKTLSSEPASLQTQAHHLTASLTSLTHTSYPTFLSLHTTTTTLTNSLDALSSSLDALITTSLPKLEDSASGWRERTEDVLNERQKARVVLEQHEKLRDLLDIPLLIDTCARNGYFAEALQLAAHANALSTWSTGAPLIVTSILAEVHQSINQMLLSLIATLHEPSRKLPPLWKAVNFLRKMNSFESGNDVDAEEQIALVFIGGRESCLKAALEGSKRDIERLVGAGGDLVDKDRDDIAKYLKKFIDTWREGVYDIITQFATIFLERPTGASQQQPSPPASSPALHKMLSTYALHSLQTHLLPVLSFTLPHIPLPSLPSLLTQVTYCATAFGRVGLDFRGTLDGLFSSAVLSGVTSEVKAATGKWIKTFKSNLGSDANTPTTATMKRKTYFVMPSKFLVVSSSKSSPPTPATSSIPSSSTSSQPHMPPQVLASYPPLAAFTNSLLSTFNNLRLLAPISVLRDLQIMLDASLAEGAQILLVYIRKVLNEDGSMKKDRMDDLEQVQEEMIAKAAGEIYFTVFAPFVRRALGEGVYGIERDYLADLSEPEDETNLTSLTRVTREWESWRQSRG
ncbi:Dor1-like family-domain-containing protein [Mycena floridula]|nr:Dor1-like family-domain-containing protein [Mycena floridula]